MTARPAHHLPDGRFRNPWLTPAAARHGSVLRWQWERLRKGTPPNPAPGALPRVASAVARPRAQDDEIRITWVGHSTFLVQAGGLNLLTDPVWGRRASPFRWIGPARFVDPGVDFDDLPPIDAVLLSHDHYDHLDEPTVARLRDRPGPSVRWFTPLGYRGWFGRRGISPTELDWWGEAAVEAPNGSLRIVALPARHWTRRGLRELNDRLWSAWALITPRGQRIFFGGDSAYFGGYAEIGARLGPFDTAMLPIGAYELRWFMRTAHMNPEEAVRAYLDLGGAGAFVAMHCGTFRLTDEDPLEPPVRTRAAWEAAHLPAAALHVPRHGETITL